MKKPLKAGITGGIGSGKSVVCRVLETMGYPVYNSDLRAKELMENDAAVREKLLAAFGPETFSGGTLNRTYLAQKAFGDPQQLQLLNSIVHPAVRSDFNAWAERQDHSVVFQESALLFETGARRLFDFTVLVTAPLEERIRRVMLRDNADEEKIRARIASQLPDEEKIPLADAVIRNGKDDLVVPQVNEMLAALLSRNAGA